MNPAASTRRLLLLILLSIGLSLATAGLLKVALDAALPGPDWLQELVRYQPATPAHGVEGDTAYDLGRVARRWLMVVSLVVFVIGRGAVPWRRLVRVALAAEGARRRQLLFGCCVGVALAFLYGGALLLSGSAVWSPAPAAYLLRKVVEYGVGAVLIAFIEELFFRAVMLRLMVRAWGVARGVLASSTVFAVLHCISGKYWVSPGWDPSVGLGLLASWYADHEVGLAPDLRLIAGLILLGVLLSLLYLRSGSLWASIGLHGGVVFVVKLFKKLLERRADTPEWLLGDRLFIVSGVLWWAVLAVLILVIPRLVPGTEAARRRDRLR